MIDKLVEDALRFGKMLCAEVRDSQVEYGTYFEIILDVARCFDFETRNRLPESPLQQQLESPGHLVHSYARDDGNGVTTLNPGGSDKESGSRIKVAVPVLRTINVSATEVPTNVLPTKTRPLPSAIADSDPS